MAMSNTTRPSAFPPTLPPFPPGGTNASARTGNTSAFIPFNAPAGTPDSCLWRDLGNNGDDLRLTLATLYSLFFVVGLAGNSLALWVFLCPDGRRPGGGGVPRRMPRHNNSVRVLLINCVAADMVLLACLPFRVYYHLNKNHWGLGSMACRLVGNLFYMNMYISIALLGLIGMDRCLRLSGARPCRASSVRGREGEGSKRWSWVVSCAIWLVSLTALAPMVVATEGNEEVGRCFQYKQRLKATGKAYFNAALVVLFWAVFAALVVSYGHIAALLLRVSRERPGLPNARRYERTARNSFFVLFVFAVCFGPYHAFRPVYLVSQLDPDLSCEHAATVDRTNEVMLLLSAFNSCLDPIMFFMLSGSVRKNAAFVLSGLLGAKRVQFPNDVNSNSSMVEMRHLSRPALAAPAANATGARGNGPSTSRRVREPPIVMFNAGEPQIQLAPPSTP